MTREEAIKFAHYASGLSKEPEVREFYRMCEQALRAQQTPAKLDRSRWEGCDSCENQKIREIMLKHKRKYCSLCGKPLTEQAWAEQERRIGGMYGTTDNTQL